MFAIAKSSYEWTPAWTTLFGYDEKTLNLYDIFMSLTVKGTTFRRVAKCSTRTPTQLRSEFVIRKTGIATSRFLLYHTIPAVGRHHAKRTTRGYSTCSGPDFICIEYTHMKIRVR